MTHHYVSSRLIGVGLLFVSLGLGACSSPLADAEDKEFQDDFGRRVTLPAPPRRIISLAPSVTETLVAFGWRDRLVAGTIFDRGSEIEGLPRIGSLDAPDMEMIVTLRPDLVIGTNLTPPEVASRLDALEIPAAFFHPTSLADTLADMRRMAILIEPNSAVNPPARWVEIETLHRRLLQKQGQTREPRPRVLLLLGLGDTVTAGRGTFAHEIVELAGGTNVGGAVGEGWPRLTMEAILAADPQAILVTCGTGADSRDTLETSWQALRQDPKWRSIAAVRRNRLIVVPDDLITIPGPRLLEAVPMISEALQEP
jgi:iron complex transport system substrate-binding protein